MLIPTLLPHEILHAVAAAGQEQAWFQKDHKVFSRTYIYNIYMHEYIKA